ncbi:MAG: hypothetical protein M3Q58_11655 [Bacteroidota bacterium]|nr:hypothetical protein [Bacteroidota bacterium]
MKFLKRIAVVVLLAGLIFNLSSCIILYPKDNGKHKGWFKNSKNPHHPHSTNPGKSKGNKKNKGR